MTKNNLHIRRFEDIYTATYPRLHSFINRYLHDPDAVKDILQDCYIQLWKKIDTIDGDEKILPMLKTWAIHLTSNTIRKNAKDRQRQFVWLQQQPSAFDTTQNLQWKENLATYHRAVDKLPSQQRLVFKLTKEEGLSHQEVATRLDISIHTIKRHLHEATKTLKAKLPDYGLFVVLVSIECHVFTF